VRLSEGSARGSRRKQLFSERPSGSFTSGGFPKEANVLREASPLAAFRRKRTGFEKSASFGLLPKEGRPSLPSASFGKLHLWRGGGFPKEAPEFQLFSERPSGSFTSGGFLKEASPLALPSESFTSGGFLREATPLVGTYFLKRYVGKRRRLGGDGWARTLVNHPLRAYYGRARTPCRFLFRPSGTARGQEVKLTYGLDVRPRRTGKTKACVAAIATILVILAHPRRPYARVASPLAQSRA